MRYEGYGAVTKDIGTSIERKVELRWIDDSEKTVRIFSAEVEKLSQKIIEATKISENRSHQLIENIQEINKQMGKMGEKFSEKNNNLNMDQLNENLSNSLNKFFNKNLKDKLNELFSSEHFKIPVDKNLLKDVEENKKEIENILSSFDEFKTNMNKENELNKLESKLALLNRKIFDLDENLGKNRIDFEEKFKSIEGDGNFIGDKDLQNELYPNTSDYDVYDGLALEPTSLQGANVRHHRMPTNANPDRKTITDNNEELNIAADPPPVLPTFNKVKGVEAPIV